MRIPDHPTLLRRMIDSRLKRLTPAGPLLAATLVQTQRHCGKPNCRCLQGGPKHPATHLTHKVNGKTQAAYVPKDLLTEVRAWIDEHKRIKRLLKEIHLLTWALVQGHARHRRRKKGRP
jgi:hypothetical protein